MNRQNDDHKYDAACIFLVIFALILSFLLVAVMLAGAQKEDAQQPAGTEEIVVGGLEQDVGHIIKMGEKTDDGRDE